MSWTEANINERIKCLQLDNAEINNIVKKHQSRLITEEGFKKLIDGMSSRQKPTMEAVRKQLYIDKANNTFKIIVPGSYDELRQYINDWLPACDEFTKKGIAKFKRALKIRSLFKGYGLNRDMEDHLVARFIAGALIKQIRAEYTYFTAYLYAHKEQLKHGSTHLIEAYIISESVLENTKVIGNDRGTTVSIYDDLRVKGQKKIKNGVQWWW